MKRPLRSSADKCSLAFIVVVAVNKYLTLIYIARMNEKLKWKQYENKFNDNDTDTDYHGICKDVVHRTINMLFVELF